MKDMMNSAEFFKLSREVYGWLADDLSKNIFEARLAWSSTQSLESVEKLVTFASDYTQEMIENHKKRLNSAKEIVLYGAGELGQNFYKQFQLSGKNVSFCDRQYESIPFVLGVPVISPEKMLEKIQHSSDYVVVICAIPGFQFIFDYLTGEGVKQEHILPFLCHDEKNIYFEDFITFGSQEVFVDGGSYDGMNGVELLQRCPTARILSFEADRENLPKIEETFQQHQVKDYEIFDVGLWSEETVLKFSANGTVGSMIDEDGSVSISCNSLDHLLAEEQVSFIKMDIEGAELEALKGAALMIQKHKPKLAISIYHKKEDILELPLYIKSLVPEYKLYLRHYTNVETDTVLYAIL